MRFLSILFVATIIATCTIFANARPQRLAAFYPMLNTYDCSYTSQFQGPVQILNIPKKEYSSSLAQCITQFNSTHLIFHNKCTNLTVDNCDSCQTQEFQQINVCKRSGTGYQWKLTVVDIDSLPVGYNFIEYYEQEDKDCIHPPVQLGYVANPKDSCPKYNNTCFPYWDAATYAKLDCLKNETEYF